MRHPDEIEMEVFRSGDYGAKGAYTEATLDQIAADYRPDLLEAPLTFDHAQAGPAYGWVSRLRREGDRLVAAVKGVPAAVREMLRAGSYKRRSVELFRVMPQTGRPYLRAVSLLGAATPEVKGLRDICFSANPAASSEATNAVVQLEGEDTLAAATDSQDNTADDLRRQLLQQRIALMFAELRADGYCLASRDAEAIRHIFAEHEDTVRFDDGTAQATLEWMAGFLRQHLVRAPLGEAAGDAGRAETFGQGSAATTGFTPRTHPRSAALHSAALALQQATPGLAYRDALLRAAH